MAKKEKKEEEKFSSVAELTAAVNKRFGTGTLMIGRGSMVNVEVFPTNIATLDLALGCGGVPRGRVFELFGTESSGKTTTCLQIIAACQKHIFKTNGVEHNGVAAFIDAEHAFDPAWAAAIGVDNEALLFSQPSSGDEALMVAEMLVKSGQVQLVIIDSVAALIPKSVLDGEVTDNTIGQQAQLMSKSCGRLAGAASKTKTAVIFINQIREKVGVMFGSPETTPGGRALKFYSSIRMDIRKGQPVKKDEVVLGFQPTVKIIKNKVAPPFRTAEYTLCVGTPELPIKGVDLAGALIDVAEDAGVVLKAGTSYSFTDPETSKKLVLGAGAANAAAKLRDEPSLFERIQQVTYGKLFGSLKKIEPVEVKPVSLDDTDGDDYNPILDDEEEPPEDN